MFIGACDYGHPFAGLYPLTCNYETIACIIQTGPRVYPMRGPCCLVCFTYKINAMKKNMGNADRVIRILIALAIGALYYFNVISGTLGLVLVVLAGVFLLTSLAGFCPLYRLVGVNTCPRKAVG